MGAFATHAHKLAAARVNIHVAAAVRGGAVREDLLVWEKTKDVRRAGKALPKQALWSLLTW